MIMASQLEAASTAQFVRDELRLQCPRCGAWIGNLPDRNTAGTTPVCSDCCFKTVSEDGIWNSVMPERSAQLSRFIEERLGDPDQDLGSTRIEASFGIHWQAQTPNRGVYHLMRQVITRLQGDQEPPQLQTYSAKARK